MNTRIVVVAGLSVASGALTAEAAKQVSGIVDNVDPVKNELKLSRTNEQGQQEQVTLKWNENLLGAQALETAKIGSQLSIEANPSFGAWEVARVIPESQGSQRAAQSSGQTSQAAQSTQGASRQY